MMKGIVKKLKLQIKKKFYSNIMDKTSSQKKWNKLSFRKNKNKNDSINITNVVAKEQ